MKLTRRTSGNGSPSPKDGVVLPKDTVVPNHVALICDGNRRWAKARGLEIFEGHKAGGKAIGEIARACRGFGIHTFTVWVFSTENWSRGEKEALGILRLIEKAVDEHIREAKKEKVRIVHLGRKDRIPESLARKLARAEEDTKDNTKYIFNLAIDYGGHDEIVRAIKGLMSSNDNITAHDVDEKLFASYLDTNDQPYPFVDLLIRTSGEQRTSGFLPWQTNYAEIWWEESYLPDFTRARFFQALLDYSRRHRRFGGSETAHRFSFRPQLVARLELDWWRARKFKNEEEFARAFKNYVREQFDVSLGIAKDAADMFARALFQGETEGDWKGTKRILTRFYSVIKRNVKLAFEPSLLASLEVKYLQDTKAGESDFVDTRDTVQEFYSELFRIPRLQASKIAHLRMLAQDYSQQAEEAIGTKKKELNKRAEDYLTRSYEALKERMV